MRILMSSYSFSPSIGGLETVSSILAHEFLRHGNEVKLATQSSATDMDHFPFEVIRQPRWNRLFDLVRWCDVYFQNNVSLGLAWPLLLVRRPWAVTHQVWIPHDWKGCLKRLLIRSASASISISQAIADDVDPESIIIPNPYRDDVFYEMQDIPEDRELIFVGRLGMAKGEDILLKALLRLKARGRELHLTLVGIGRDEVIQNIKQTITQLGLEQQVDFVGLKHGDELARLMNRHEVMVLPSVWQEPFGVVALEGIACGCVVVGSEGGGLKDAIGPCGVVFPNGDVEALADRLDYLFSHPETWHVHRSPAAEHLARHAPGAVAQAYLQVMEATLR